MERIGRSRIGRLALTGAGGLAAGVGMLVAPLWMLTPIGVGLFLFVLWSRTPSLKSAALQGFLFGFLTSGAGLLSLWEIIPPSYGWDLVPSVLSAGMLWLVPTLALGAASIPIALLLYLVRKNIFAPFAAAALLILSEELKSWAWMLITWGPGAAPEPHLSIAALGYALADSSYLLQLAEGCGLTCLSGATALYGAALASLAGPTAQKVCAVALAGIVSLLPLAYRAENIEPMDTLRVAIVSTTVGLEAPYDASVLLSKITNSPSPDVLIFPEGKRFESMFTPAQVAHATAWAAASEPLVIRSEATERDGGRYNTIVYEIDSEAVAIRDKRFVMPQGEYVPYLSDLFLSLLPGSQIPVVQPLQEVRYGTVESAASFRGATFAAFVCSEVFSAHLYRSFVQKTGANVLVTVADPIWFRGSPILYRKTVQIAKVHAVESRAYFIAAQNASPSFVINPRGKMVAESTWGATDLLFYDLPISLGPAY